MPSVELVLSGLGIVFRKPPKRSPYNRPLCFEYSSPTTMLPRPSEKLVPASPRMAYWLESPSSLSPASPDICSPSKSSFRMILTVPAIASEP